MLPRKAKRLLATQSRALAWHGGVPIVVSGWDVGRWQGVHRPRYLVLCLPPGAAATLSGMGVYRLGPFPRHSLQGRKRYPFWYGGVPFLVWGLPFMVWGCALSGMGVYRRRLFSLPCRDKEWCGSVCGLGFAWYEVWGCTACGMGVDRHTTCGIGVYHLVCGMGVYRNNSAFEILAHLASCGMRSRRGIGGPHSKETAPPP